MSESFVQLEILKLQTDMSFRGHVQQKNNGMTDRDIFRNLSGIQKYRIQKEPELPVAR